MKCYLVHRRQEGVNSRVGVNQWSELIQHDSIKLINTGYKMMRQPNLYKNYKQNTYD